MHQRSPHPRRYAARPSRASVHLRPMSQNLLEAKFCAKPFGSSSARPWFVMPTLVPRFTRPSSAPAELSRLMRRGSPAQSLLAMTTVVRTRHEDPGPSHLLREEKSSKCAGPPCGTPRGRVVLVSLPLSGFRRTPQDGTCTAPTLGAGWCRVTPTSRGSTVSRLARLLRVLDRLPTGSFGNCTHGP